MNELFMKIVRNTPLLERDEEIALAKQAKMGDIKARDKLVKHNLRLVISIAKKYYYNSITFEDLVQEGTIGLMHAIERFDWTRNIKLSTYATWWIRQAMSKALLDKAAIVRKPAHIVSLLSKVRKLKKKYISLHGEIPPIDYVANELNIEVDKLRSILSDAQDTSLVDDMSKLDYINSVVQNSNLTSSIEFTNVNAVESDITLSDEEEEIVLMRFGLHDNTNETNDEQAT